MPKPLRRLHVMSSREAERSQRLLRNSRENYVASRIRRVMQEEATLMLAFDTTKDLGAKLQIHAALTRQRLLVLRFIGWPKEPTLKGAMPRCLDNAGNYRPMLDIDAPSIGDPEPVAEG